MNRTFGRYLGIGALGYAGICAFMFLAQHSLLYHPTPEVEHDGAEALRLEHAGETLKVWKAGDGPHAVLYFGGNAEDVAYNIDEFKAAFDDTALYFVNYRGYGGSTGSPSEEALYEDAAFVFDYAAERHSRVSAIGRSLGSGVAVWLAAERPVAKLVLVTPYDSIESVAKSLYPFLPVSLLIRDRYPSVERVPEVDAPTLIVYAENDSIIPNENTLALAEAFPEEQLEIRRIENVGHNSVSYPPEYMRSITEFLASAAVGEDTDRPQD